MSVQQITYALILAALSYPAWGKQRAAMLALWVNMLAVLAVCLAMDLGAIGRDTATLSMMIADLATGAALATKPGAARIIALGYAVTVPIYSVNLVFGVPIIATFGYIYLAAFAQLGVLAIGTFGGDGGGSGRRHVSVRHPVAISRGNSSVYQRAISSYTGKDRMQG
jgi:hypothetical protein